MIVVATAHDSKKVLSSEFQASKWHTSLEAPECPSRADLPAAWAAACMVRCYTFKIIAGVLTHYIVCSYMMGDSAACSITSQCSTDVWYV